MINNDSEPFLINSITKAVPIYYFGRKRKSKNPLFIIYLYKYLIKYRPDIIHFHSSKLYYYLLPYKILFNTILIVTVHGKGEVTKTTSKFDRVVFISKKLKNDFLNISKDKSIVIYNGVTISNSKSILMDERIKDKTFKICQIGRLAHVDKGQDILIRSFKKYVQINNNSELHFIGEGNSLKYLSKLVDDLNLNNKIKFLGKQSREYIYNILPNYHLMVQPSRNEGFGLTVVESMLLSTPVLVSSDTGAAEVIENGKYGYIFNTKNEVDCCQKLIGIWDSWKKGQIFNKISKAQIFAETRFSLNEMIVQYEKLYHKLYN